MSYDYELSEQNSFQSDQDSNLAEQMNKTKQLTTKFFTQLNKHQKTMNRKFNNDDFQKSCSKKKIKKSGNTSFKEMIMQSRRFLEEQYTDLQQAGQGIYKSISVTKKRVRFNSNGQEKDQPKQEKQRKTSLEKATFNFCDTIKKLGIQLNESNKQTKGANDVAEQTNQSLLNGYTEKEFIDGTMFKGICQNGVIVKGQLQFNNGFVYDGELFLDKFHGKGKLTLPKKQVIEADFVEGEIVGKATIKYPKGQIYYGDLKNFRRHGIGHLFFADGSKYQGQFTNGQLTGYGVYISTLGQKLSGYWFYGDYVGANEQVFENVITNIEAHEKKKSQRDTKKKRNSKSVKTSKTESIKQSKERQSRSKNKALNDSSNAHSFMQHQHSEQPKQKNNTSIEEFQIESNQTSERYNRL